MGVGKTATLECRVQILEDRTVRMKRDFAFLQHAKMPRLSILLHIGNGVCHTSRHEAASLVQFQLQSKLELARVLGQPLIALQAVSDSFWVVCHTCVQLVLDSMCTKFAHVLAWLNAVPSIAASGASAA